jgi:DNA-nicking Smr family endonuclease
LKISLPKSIPTFKIPCSLFDILDLHIMARIKIDLHPIYNNSAAIDKALLNGFEEAIAKKIREVEIIPGKGSGQLKKKGDRFLHLPHIKPLYHRVENDSKNHGRLFVYFRF